MEIDNNKEGNDLKKLFFDIETLPASGEQMQIIKDLFEEYKKKNGKKAAETTFDNFFRSTSFSGEFGRIFCVGYAIDNQPVECLVGEEKKMLEDFWRLAGDVDLFIGHN